MHPEMIVLGDAVQESRSRDSGDRLFSAASPLQGPETLFRVVTTTPT